MAVNREKSMMIFAQKLFERSDFGPDYFNQPQACKSNGQIIFLFLTCRVRKDG